MTKALYRKWRPKDWDEVVAQEHVIQTLRNAVIHDRVAHAYLFAGPRGTGKTTCARLLAKSVNCLEPELEKRPCNQCNHCLALNEGRFMDLIEIDAASNTSVDDVRDLREKINFSPSQGQYKVYIIDEVHMLSTAAFNALLKTLEEPPPHAIFVLATTEIHKIPATVLSRCQRHEFRRIPIEDIVRYLKEKSQEENFHVEETVYTEIARQATGSLRDAISLLDQLTSTQENITLEMAQKILGTATDLRVIDLVSALIVKDTAEGLRQINLTLDSGTDPRQFARQIVTYLRNVLLYKMDNPEQVKAAEEIMAKIEDHAGQFTIPDLLRAIESFNQATVEERANWHPGLGLELAFTSYLSEPLSVKVEEKQPEEPKAVKKNTQERSKPQSSAEPEKVQPAKKTASEEIIAEDKHEENKKPIDKKTDVKKEKKEHKPKEETDIEKAEKHQPAEEMTIHDIQRSWPQIKAKVGKHNPRTEALLNSSKLTGLKENTLYLGFTSDTLKGMMEKEGNITLTSDILEEFYGKPMFIKCIVTTRQGSALPEDVDIEKDGMVGTATRDLGGKISSAEEAE
jgi:DNA polymerase III subunit gamma/tau